jgi:serpin B
VTSAPFTTASGSVEQVPTMTGEFHTSAPASYVDEGVTAVELPYSGGRFAALMIEPTGTSLPKYLAALTPKSLTGLTAQLRSRPADVHMPTLSLNTTAELADPLKALGVTDVFKSGQADLTGLSPQADHVAFVKQQATLNVDTKGTTAAAATAIGVEQASASAATPIELTFDHPFLFLILDTTTGGILFGSAVNNPTAH